MVLDPDVGRFLEYKRVECNASHNTLDSYKSALRHFAAWLCQQGKAPISADRDDLRKYLSACSERGLTPRSIAHRVTVLRELFKHFQRDRLIHADPMVRIEAPKQWKRVYKAISEEEMTKLLHFPVGKRATQELRDRAILELLYASGIRVSELVSATLADLNLEAQSLMVFGKGSKERIVPFGLPATRAIRAYLDLSRPFLAKSTPSRFVFIGQMGNQMSRQLVWKIIQKRSDQAMIGVHISPHVARHSCATHLLDHGMDLRTIQEILGHADISTTEGYLKVSQRQLKEILARCHPRANPKHLQMPLFATKPPVPLPDWIPCSECAKPAVPGAQRCEQHREGMARAGKRNYQKRRAVKRAFNLCSQCAQPRQQGKTLCETHLKQLRERSRRLRADAKKQAA